MISEEETLKLVVKTIIDKKGIQPVVLDLREVSPLTDYFLIVSGNTSRQVKALKDAIDEALSKFKIEPKSIEGLPEAKWVLMDYSDFVIHIFDEETREFYGLERLWRHAVPVSLKSLEESAS